MALTKRGEKNPRTLAQWYCLLAGAALLLAGLLGFFADGSFGANAPDGSVQGGSLLGFEVNGWHNLVHLASGLVLLAAANTRPTAKAIALGFGLVYGLVAIIGLIDGSDVIGLIPVNSADNILHIALAALGIIAGLISKARRQHGHSADTVRTTGAGTTDAQTPGRSGRDVVGDDSVSGTGSTRVGH